MIINAIMSLSELQASLTEDHAGLAHVLATFIYYRKQYSQAAEIAPFADALQKTLRLLLEKDDPRIMSDYGLFTVVCQTKCGERKF